MSGFVPVSSLCSLNLLLCGAVPGAAARREADLGWVHGQPQGAKGTQLEGSLQLKFTKGSTANVLPGPIAPY